MSIGPVVWFAVNDLNRAEHFYADGLGWRTARSPANAVTVEVAAQFSFVLWDLNEFHDHVGATVIHDGHLPFMLAYNATKRREVDEVMAAALSANAVALSAASERDDGAYVAVFLGPDDCTWRVVCEPPYETTA